MHLFKPESGRSGQRGLLYLLLPLAVILVAWVVWLGHPDFPLDDAYIVLHAARNLADGTADPYVGGHPLYGITSPVHLALVTALSVVLPGAWPQVVLIVATTLVLAAGLYTLARQMDFNPWLAGALAVATLTSGFTWTQLANGLETGLAIAALTWAFALCLARDDVKPWHGLLIGLLPYIRPELAAVSALLLLHRLYLAVATTRYREALMFLGWAMLGAAPIAIWLWNSLGVPFPNTIGAKAEYFAEYCAPGSLRWRSVESALAVFFEAYGPLSIGLLFFFFVSGRHRLPAVFLFVFLLAYWWRLPAALFHNYSRYCYLLLPVIIYGWAALYKLSSHGVRTGLGLLLYGVTAVSLWSFPTAWANYKGGVDFSRVELQSVTQWVAHHLPPGSRLMVHDAGYIASLSQYPLVDLVGLKTPWASAVYRQTKETSCRPADPVALDLIFQKSSPDYFVVLKGIPLHTTSSIVRKSVI